MDKDKIFEAIYEHVWLRAIEIAPKLLVTLLLLFIIHLVLKSLMTKFDKHIDAVKEKGGADKEGAAKRAKTISNVVRKTLFITLWIFGAIMILSQMGINVGPILAGAGILGLAIGFGAQNLARDFISGLFLLMENQLRVGDVAEINGTGGVVEDINLRTVILRDGTGSVHVFPNGSISKMTNRTIGWSAFMLDMGVAYKEDTDHVVSVMTKVAEEMAEDEAYKKDLIHPFEMMGVDAFGDSAVVIKCRLKTKPGMQWPIGREYRRRLKKAFDAEGIEIPFPHMSLYFGDVSKPVEVLMKDRTAS